MMDHVERAVLRRKSVLLRHVLSETQGVLEECQRQGLVSEADGTKIKKQSGDGGVGARLLTLLEENGVASFEKVCFLLERLNLSWVADELRVELAAERGQLKVEAYVSSEAQGVVTRMLDGLAADEEGQVDLEELRGRVEAAVARRYQVGKETWKRQVARKQKQLDREREMVRDGISRSSEIVAQFVRTKGPQMGVSVESAYWDNEVRAPLHSSSAALSILKNQMEKLSVFFESVADVQIKLLEERECCLRMLHEADPGASLLTVLQSVLSKSAGELGRTKIEMENKKEIAQGLDSQIKSLRLETSRQLLMKQQEVDAYRRATVKRDEEIHNLQDSIFNMKRSDEIMKAQVEYWKQRCDILEKTRRLGYYYNQGKTSKDNPRELWEEVVENVTRANLSIPLGGMNDAPSISSSVDTLPFLSTDRTTTSTITEVTKRSPGSRPGSGVNTGRRVPMNKAGKGGGSSGLKTGTSG